jgi:alpha-amylase
MPSVRLILALHDHQPVGNFDDVFETAYQTSYRPFLDVLEDYPDIPFALHTSGPLLEWLSERHPDYVQRVRTLVQAGRVEILGGGFFEPILTMIPHRDRVGQIRQFSDHLQAGFGQPIRGMWVPERVWEQHLVAALAESGIEYTLLDDFHFQRTGLTDPDLFGYYLTEDEGRLLKVFPVSERLRYLIPFQEPHAIYEYLREVVEDRPGCTIVFADDGEKFGSWPDTHDHVYTKGWLRRFCDMIVGNREWIHPLTPSQAIDQTLPLGKIFLSDASYREMTEWVLPAEKQLAYHRAVRQAQGKPGFELVKPYVRAGGYWRNFRAQYSEADEMYCRMLGVSNRLAAADPKTDPDYIEAARQELFRGQCNCPYWHGAFGGLYLPHLRNAIYHHLIAADMALDDAQGKSGPWVDIEVGDLNLDLRQEVRLANDRLIALVRPATGGHLYELDVKHALINVLATLDRRPEPYHAAVAAAAHGDPNAANYGPAVSEKVILKSAHLDRRLIYDRYPRKALVDHIFPMDVSLENLIAGLDIERGDFVVGAYLSKFARTPKRATLIMERPGRADRHTIHIRKTIALEAGRPILEIDYMLDELPVGEPIHFAVELNLAGMAGHADDRYFLDDSGTRLGPLDSPLDLAPTGGLRATDEWLDLTIALSWSQPAGVWCYPIETVSQSEAGFEAVYQSSAVVPHWVVIGDESRHWEVRITWALDRVPQSQSLEIPTGTPTGRELLVGP